MMRSVLLFFLFVFTINQMTAQKMMTPELLVQLGKVSGKGISKDGTQVIYAVSTYNFETDETTKKTFSIPLEGGTATEIENVSELLVDASISPNGNFKLTSKEVKLEKVLGVDVYDDVPKSDVKIFNALNYRHWDTWSDGTFNHVFYGAVNASDDELIDIMPNEPYDSPQKPFGGAEDYCWGPDSKNILYVSKKLSGTAYATSTNTNIYEYNLATKKTVNLTPNNKGYDTQPSFSSKGQLAWLQMKRDGYEADKNDIIVNINGVHVNLTEGWDGTVNSFVWNEKGNAIYFIAPVDGTVQLFEIEVSIKNKAPKQLTNGQFDVSGIVGQAKNTLIVNRRDMNHAVELYTYHLKSGELKQLTHVNDAVYNSIELSKVEKRMVTTTDGKEMVSWVIYPPNFDPSKKYPTLLYCQGGPQGALSQFYSFRWNFQIMAAHGYIVIAPNRRGMPGHGVAWNEQISKDYGGQNMEDYLAAIDDISKEDYVDTNRLGAVGASYGGFSVFYLAAIHNNRFKSFIAHDGMFNLRSMYGTTEELFFVNWDLGGPYWDTSNAAAQKTFEQFNPANFVSKWNTPILIIQGGKDYRVPIGQGLEAFQAAQLQGIKSRLLYFPEENHWVLNPQNSIVWQREFFKWLKETL